MILRGRIYKNKYKIDYVKKRLNVNKKINEDKMYKVKYIYTSIVIFYGNNY